MKIYAHATFCCMILFSHEFILGVGQKKNPKCLQDKMLIFMFVIAYCPVFLSYKFVFLFICPVKFRGKLDPFLHLFSVVFPCSPLCFPIYVFSPKPFVASDLTLSLLISHISFQVCLSSLSVSGSLHPRIQRMVRCR